MLTPFFFFFLGFVHATIAQATGSSLLNATPAASRHRPCWLRSRHAQKKILWPDVFKPAAISASFPPPQNHQKTAPPLRTGELMECSPGRLSGYNMLRGRFPGQKIGFTLFLPFCISRRRPFLTSAETSSPGPLHLSGSATAPPIQMVEEYKVRSASQCNPCSMEKLFGLQPLRIHSVRASLIHQRLQSLLPVSGY